MSLDILIEEIHQNDPSLTSISLKNKKIGNSGAKTFADALKFNRTVTSIDLSGNDIGSEGASAIADDLKNNTRLKKIDFAFNKIFDDGAKAFAEALKVNHTLTSIGLSHNGIGPKGIKAIAKALKDNDTLTNIDLSGNKIRDEGAKIIAATLKDNNTLTSINLSDNQIGDKGAKAIADTLKTNLRLTKIDLTFNNKIANETKDTINQLIARNCQYQLKNSIEKLKERKFISLRYRDINNDNSQQDREATFLAQAEQFNRELDNLSTIAEGLKDYPDLYTEAQEQINAIVIDTELQLGNFLEAMQYFTTHSKKGIAPFGLLSLALAILAEKVENLSLENKIRALLYLFVDCLQSTEAEVFFKQVKFIIQNLIETKNSSEELKAPLKNISEELQILVNQLLDDNSGASENNREAVKQGASYLEELLQYTTKKPEIQAEKENQESKEAADHSSNIIILEDQKEPQDSLSPETKQSVRDLLTFGTFKDKTNSEEIGEKPKQHSFNNLK